MSVSYNPSITTNGLILYVDAANARSYPGSGTTWTDVSGYGNNGTLVNSPTFSSTNGGILGFNGSSSYVSIPDSASLRPANITVCTWAKLSSFNNPNTGIIVKPQNSTPGGAWSNPYLSWMIRVEDSGFTLSVAMGSSTTYYAARNAYGFSTNVWYFFTLTYDGTTLKGYVNAVPISSLTQTTTINYTTNPVQLAAMNYSLEYLNGNIALTQIYDRALSQNEIARNFNAHRARFGV